MKTSGFEASAASRWLRSQRLIVVGYTCWLSASLAFTASAQPVDDATRNAARELAHRAADAYERADYTTAQDLFHRAYALVPAPTLSLREARALEKLGRLVEAAEAYVKTSRTSLDSSSPEPFRQAVRQGTDELAKLRPRLPTLKIIVQGGSSGDQVSVAMDGRPLRAALIGVDMPADPGTHQITASTASGAGAQQSVVLKEAEKQSVTLQLKAGAGAAMSGFAGTHPVQAGRPPAPEERPIERSSSQRSWAFVSLGIGAAGLGVGAVTGLMAVNRHSNAEEGCRDGNECEPNSSAAEDVDAFRTLRTVSTVGYIVGVVGIGTGVTLFLTAPKSTERAKRHVTPFLGLGRLGVSGRF